MKKGVVIILVILVLVVLIVAGYFVKIRFDERESYVNEYNLLRCWVDCPIVPDKANSSLMIIDQNCTESCSHKNFPNEKYITHEWLECNAVWIDTHSYTELQNCWKDALPKIKEKYPYVAKG